MIRKWNIFTVLICIYWSKILLKYRNSTRKKDCNRNNYKRSWQRMPRKGHNGFAFCLVNIYYWCWIYSQGKKSEIYLHFLFYEQTDYPESSGISEVLAYYILFNVLFTHYFPIPVANMWGKKKSHFIKLLQ